MKSNILSKLKQYSMLSASVLGVQAVNAQSGIYTPVNDTLNGDQLFNEIDLNQDGISDIKIEYKFHDDDLELYGFECENLSSNIELAGSVPNGYNYPLKLELGSLINEEIEWLERGESGEMGWYNNGFPYFSYWNGAVDSSFIGLRMVQDQDTLYGWVRLSVNQNNSQIVVHDTYLTQRTVPALVSGDGPLSTETPLAQLSDIKITHNREKLKVMHSMQKPLDKISIYDVTGKLMSEHRPNSQTFTQNIMNFSKGIYIVLIQSEGQKTAIKIALN